MRYSRKVASALSLVAILLLTFSARTSHAQAPPGRLGIGGQLGDPSGISLKLYQHSGFAYELLAAWDLDDFFFLNGHGLYERPIPDSPLRYYLGPGLLVGFRDRPNDDDVVVGISGQFGINFFVERFEVFLHLTPRLGILPDTDGDLGGGIGLRYYL